MAKKRKTKVKSRRFPKMSRKKTIPVKSLKNIKKHSYILGEIAKAKTADRKRILMNAPSQLFTVFKQLCKYVTSGHLKLGKAQRHRNMVKNIGRTTSSTIKGMVKQHGGIFGSIIAGLLPFLKPLLGKIFG